MPNPTNKIKEEISMRIADTINEILEYRGIWDCGKNFSLDVNERIMPILDQYAITVLKEVLPESWPPKDHAGEHTIDCNCNMCWAFNKCREQFKQQAKEKFNLDI